MSGISRQRSGERSGPDKKAALASPRVSYFVWAPGPANVGAYGPGGEKGPNTGRKGAKN